MAIRPFIVDRYKAIGFYRHVEWGTSKGMLMSFSDVRKDGTFIVEFFSGEFDHEYDQRVDGSRQRFVTFSEAISIMLRWNFSPKRIEKVFKDIKTYGIAKEIAK